MQHKIDFAVGGQALIEGVMMRSPSFVTMTVRKSDGSIKSKEEPFRPLVDKLRLKKIPLARGIVNLLDMMIVGMHAINFSAQEYAEDDEETTSGTLRQAQGDTKTPKWFATATFAFSIVVSLALAILMFKVIPLAITEWLRSFVPAIEKHYILFNVIDGSLRILIFLLYVSFLLLFKSFRRIFEYHGAEHMAVYTYEKGLQLTAENAHGQSRFHPRCGTSFLLVIFIASIVIYSFVPRNPIFWLNLTQRICVIPFIAAVGYEILKWSAKRRDNLFVKILIAPGLWSQRLTTRKPDDSQLEIALHALSKAVELEEKESKKTYAPNPASVLFTSK